MATTEVTAQNFESLVEKPGILVLDWWAAWCGPCKMFAPIFDEASDRHTDITWGKVNTDEQQQLAGAFVVQSIPTLMVFRDGFLVFERAGVIPGDALDKLVEAVRALDMDEVKQQHEEMMKAQEGGEEPAP